MSQARTERWPKKAMTVGSWSILASSRVGSYPRTLWVERGARSEEGETRSEHEGREEHFTSLRRLNSLLGILEQESEREMQAPAPAGSLAKVNSFDNLC